MLANALRRDNSEKAKEIFSFLLPHRHLNCALRVHDFRFVSCSQFSVFFCLAFYILKYLLARSTKEQQGSEQVETEKGTRFLALARGLQGKMDTLILEVRSRRAVKKKNMSR